MTPISPPGPPRAARRLFFIKLALAAAPFVVAFGALAAALIAVGESMPLAWVVAAQQAEPATLYRPRYAARDLAYKALAANTRRPQVLALGSSRILQFRADFFREPGAFYNAAGPGWTLDEVAATFDAIDPPPRLLLLALDPPWFNAAYVQPEIPAQQTDLEAIVSANIGFLHDWLIGVPFDRPGWDANDYLARTSGGSPALGMRAIRDGHGFRGDGSELYGDFLVAGWLNMQAARETHAVWLREGREMYAPADAPGAAALADLAALLARAQARGVEVVGFWPAYAPSIWGPMQADPRFGYLAPLAAQTEALFADQGFALFDYSDSATLGTPEAEFFDGWHASERANALLLADLAARSPAVAAVVDGPPLRSAALATADPFRMVP